MLYRLVELVEDIGVDGLVLGLLREGDLVHEGLVGVIEALSGSDGSLLEGVAARNLVLRGGVVRLVCTKVKLGRSPLLLAFLRRAKPYLSPLESLPCTASTGATYSTFAMVVVSG